MHRNSKMLLMVALAILAVGIWMEPALADKLQAADRLPVPAGEVRRPDRSEAGLADVPRHFHFGGPLRQ